MKPKRSRPRTTQSAKLRSVPEAGHFTPAEEAFFAAGSQELETSPAESFDDLDVSSDRKPSLISRFFSRRQVG